MALNSGDERDIDLLDVVALVRLPVGGAPPGAVCLAGVPVPVVAAAAASRVFADALSAAAPAVEVLGPYGRVRAQIG